MEDWPSQGTADSEDAGWEDSHPDEMAKNGIRRVDKWKTDLLAEDDALLGVESKPCEPSSTGQDGIWGCVVPNLIDEVVDGAEMATLLNEPRQSNSVNQASGVPEDHLVGLVCKLFWQGKGRWLDIAQFIAGLTQDELMTQVAALLQQIHKEYLGPRVRSLAGKKCLHSRDVRYRRTLRAVRDVVAYRICQLTLVEYGGPDKIANMSVSEKCWIGCSLIRSRIREVLEKHDREWALVSDADIDGLRKEGFICEQFYELCAIEKFALDERYDS